MLYEQRKNYDSAIHHLKIAVTEEKNATALYNLAYIYEESGDPARAKEYYNETLKADPHHFQASTNLAIIQEKEGRNQDAGESL